MIIHRQPPDSRAAVQFPLEAPLGGLTQPSDLSDVNPADAPSLIVIQFMLLRADAYFHPPLYGNTSHVQIFPMQT